MQSQSRKPRIKGLETEYSIKFKNLEKVFILNQTECLILNNPKKILKEFLLNGARYYIDAGRYPEYATPECLTVKDVVIFDKAGEKILINDFSQFCLSIQKTNYGIGRGGFFNLQSGVRGCHENYLIKSELMEPKQKPLILTLIPFLITRQILTGRGGIYINPRDNKIYPVISKRAFIIENIIGEGTTQNRAIICTGRGTVEPFSNIGHRLHLILGDTNLSEYSTFLKLGTTDLMLTLLENNALPPLFIDNPVNTMYEISTDLEFKNVYDVLMPSGQWKKMSAIDIQFWHLNLAQKFFETIIEPFEEEKFILNLWQETLDGLIRDPMSLSDRLDYLIVLRLLEELKTILGSSADEEKFKTIDFLYSELLPEKSWYLKQINYGNIKRLLTDEEINYAIDHPPSNTRALLRSNLIKIILEEEIGELFKINWDIIHFVEPISILSIIHQTKPDVTTEDLLLKLSNPYLVEDRRYELFKDLIISLAEDLRSFIKRKKFLFSKGQR